VNGGSIVVHFSAALSCFELVGLYIYLLLRVFEILVLKFTNFQPTRQNHLTSFCDIADSFGFPHSAYHSDKQFFGSKTISAFPLEAIKYRETHDACLQKETSRK